jgi:hypothetical protein
MHISDAVRSLDRDLHEIFGARLESLVAYGTPVAAGAPATTLAVAADLSAADLRACASKVRGWHERGLATPLLVASHEFERSLDSFPFEFGAILADHAVVSGRNPFEGLRVDPADLRRACEIQARGILVHLREGFIETEGRSDRLVALLHRSRVALTPLLANVARLVSGQAMDAVRSAEEVERHLGVANAGLVEIVSSSEAQPLTADAARRIFPAYLTALDRLAGLVDTWTAA